jgi:hypothetical protein
MNLSEVGEGTPKSSVSEARLRLLELTPVTGFCAFVVDKATYQTHYRGMRRTEQVISKKANLSGESRFSDLELAGTHSRRVHKSNLIKSKVTSLEEEVEIPPSHPEEELSPKEEADQEFFVV